MTNIPAGLRRVADLADRHAPGSLHFPRSFQLIFSHNCAHVTREASRDVAQTFNSLVARGEGRVRARRFIL